MRRHLLLAFGLIAVPASAQYPGATPPPAERRAGFDAITLRDARTHLNFLAGPVTEGRGTGQPGYQKAAEYVAARFREYGLKPVGAGGTYFQNVPFVRRRTRPGYSAIRVVGTAVKVMRDNEITFGDLPTDLAVTAPVVFVRARGAEARLADSTLLEGKVVIVSGQGFGRPLRNQLLSAKTAVIVYVSPSVPPVTDWTVRRTRTGARRGGSSVGYLKQAAAERVATALGAPGAASGLEQLADNSAVSVAAKRNAKVVAKVQEETVQVPNVVGLLEGTDPRLKEEVVGIGAHLDHLGRQGMTVFPGADDDASGSTALLLVAKGLSVNPVKPRRSVLFMAFCGEEMGLIGSSYYVNNPVVPNERMVAELQMDMVGRNEETRTESASENVDTIHLVGSKRISMELHNIIEAQNTHVNFRFEYDEEDVYTRSDHYMFAAKGIPIAFLFDGFHPDYHQPTDTPDKINFDKIVSAARLFYLVAHELATREERPKKDARRM